MPNSVSMTGDNFPNGVFLPEVWSKELNVKLYPATILNLVTNNRFEGEVVSFGSTVKIRNIPTVEVKKYVQGQGISRQSITDDAINLDINQADYFNVGINDVIKAQSDINLFEMITAEAAKRMKISMETNVFSSVYADAANTVAQLALSETNVVKWLLTADAKLYQNNASEDERFVIVDPLAGMVIQNSDLKKANWTGDAMSIIRDGMGAADKTALGYVGALKIYVSNNLKVVGGVVQAIAGQREAITFASQVDKVEDYPIVDDFGRGLKGLTVYGFKTVKPEILVNMPYTIA